jgi:hypothetical protein
MKSRFFLTALSAVALASVASLAESHYAGRRQSFVSPVPWGAIVFHYGRWGFRAGLGWFWGVARPAPSVVVVPRRGNFYGPPRQFVRHEATVRGRRSVRSTGARGADSHSSCGTRRRVPLPS